MGGECLNGNHKDFDLAVNTTRSSKTNNNIQYNILQKSNNFRQNSSKNIYESKHFDTYYQQRNKIFNQNSISYYEYHNKINKTISNKERANSFKMNNSGKQKKIHNFTREELQDQVNDILRIRIPFFENNILKTISSFTFLSGNGPYHEGLMFFTTNKNFYIAQSYPITFIKVYDYFKGIMEIVSFNNINKNSKKYNISEVYTPQEPITLYDVLKIIKSLPNKYNLLNDNCQNFCNNILETLNNNFKMEKEKPNNTKINFLKNQTTNRGSNIPKYKTIYHSVRFDNF